MRWGGEEGVTDRVLKPPPLQLLLQLLDYIVELQLNFTFPCRVLRGFSFHNHLVPTTYKSVGGVVAAVASRIVSESFRSRTTSRRRIFHKHSLPGVHNEIKLIIRESGRKAKE